MPSIAQDTLTGKELRKIRMKFGMSLSEFMCELGYDGSSQTVRRRFQRFETGHVEIPLPLAKLAWLLDHTGLPDWPAALVTNYQEDTGR